MIDKLFAEALFAHGAHKAVKVIAFVAGRGDLFEDRLVADIALGAKVGLMARLAVRLGRVLDVDLVGERV